MQLRILDTKTSVVLDGKQVRRLRKSLGLNGTTVAKLAGISPSYLNDIELRRKSVPLKLATKLEKILWLGKEEPNETA